VRLKAPFSGRKRVERSGGRHGLKRPYALVSAPRGRQSSSAVYVRCGWRLYEYVHGRLPLCSCELCCTFVHGRDRGYTLTGHGRMRGSNNKHED
jgi:hypothetical protein